jgi:hypothetical protein
MADLLIIVALPDWVVFALGEVSIPFGHHGFELPHNRAQ